MQGTGRCQQTGQLQFSHPHLDYNTNVVNRGYVNNSSFNGSGALINHYGINTVGMNQLSAQRQNNFLALNHSTSSCLQEYYPNSAHNATINNNAATVNLNQQEMLAHNTPVSQNTQVTIVNGNLAYCQTAMIKKTLNQRLQSRMENTSAPMNNPTTSFNMKQRCHAQQSAVQPPVNSQAPELTPYTPCTQIPNGSLLNVQNVQMYSVIPVTLLPTSGQIVDKAFTNNNNVQKNNSVSQTNESCAVKSTDGTAPFSNGTFTNIANNQSNLQSAVPVQTSHPPFVNMHTLPSNLPPPSYNNGLNTSSPPQVYRPNIKSMSPSALQTSLHTEAQFYCTRNNMSNSQSSCTPQNKASESSSCEAFSKIDTVSSAQAKDCPLQESPSRATRAVAVVLPLSQENSPVKHYSPSSLSSSNPPTDSCVFSSCKMDKATVQPLNALPLKQNLQPSNNGVNSFTDKESPEGFSHVNNMLLNVHKTSPRISNSSLTFAKLVKGDCTKILRRQKSQLGNKKSPEQKQCVADKPKDTEKPCETEKQWGEDLSSVPATEWTLGKLREKIKELEQEENECKKSESNNDDYNQARQIICRFWNGDIKALLNEARNGATCKDIVSIRNFCANFDNNSVVLSQNQSKHPSRYHVLLHDEVYKEQKSFISLWRNVNQLDDIDKEFGFPFVLRYGQEKKTEQKEDDKCQTEAEPSTPSTPPEDLQNKKVLSLNTSRNDTEKQNTSVQLNPDTEKGTDENECISNAQLQESSCLFNIEVLPPDEAKVIFEKISCDSPLRDSAIEEETIPYHQVEAENPTCHVTTLEKICCVEKWRENIFGLSSESKCKCHDQTQDYQKLDKSEQTKGGESANKSTVIISSESEDESRVYASQPGLHIENEQNLVKSTESQYDADTNKNITENSNVNESECTLKPMLIEQESTEVHGNSSAETIDTANLDCSTPVSGDDVLEIKRIACDGPNSPDLLMQPFKKPKLSTHLKSQTILESFLKSKNNREVGTVELALFGSKNKSNISSGSQKSQQSLVRSSHEQNFYFQESKNAPRRVYVKCSPLSKNDKQDVEPQGNVSVKNKVHDNWRRSFPLSTIKLKRKNKRFSIVSAIHGTTLHLSPIQHKEKKKRKFRESQDSQAGERKRTRQDGKDTKTVNPVEAGSLQENILKFNVLPSTFNFEEGSGPGNSPIMPTTSTAGEKSAHAPSPAEKTQPTNTKEAWCDKSTSKSLPDSAAAAPELTAVFQEFQKRFKERLASLDE